MRRHVGLDNAASTPPFRRVLDAVNAFAPWYGNVHRGSGVASLVSTHAYEAARDAVTRFVGADSAHDAALFTRNTTAAINLLAARWPFDDGAVVLTTRMEHHSNDLPWRRVARVEHVNVLADGRVDEEMLHDRLRALRGRVAVLAVSGASNVTGIVNPVHRWARWAHEAGARIVVDAAQLAPHRPIDLRPADDPEHLDAVAFSAHKTYAPFGAGVLVAPLDLFRDGAPYESGGGTVDSVGVDAVAWAAPPDREEAGTPPVVGAVALHAAIETYRTLGWAAVLDHETALAAYALHELARIPGVTLHGPAPGSGVDRLGVIAFDVAGVPHALVGAVLRAEWGVGVRTGCFCAHPYVKRLLRLSDDEVRRYEARVAAGDRRDLPGAVRASLGLHNGKADVDRLAAAVAAVAEGRRRRDYLFDPRHGSWHLPEEERWIRERVPVA
jgi:selenocysteine lyase/cysteine desulfurase